MFVYLYAEDMELHQNLLNFYIRLDDQTHLVNYLEIDYYLKY